MGLIKTEKDIDGIRESCRIVSDVLKHIKLFIQHGVKTVELNAEIESYILSRNAIPAFKGYGGNRKLKPFPAAACISVNNEVVHGIPGERVILDGDIVSVDVGVKKNGYYGDSAFTFPVGTVSSQNQQLLKVTQESLLKGIAQAIDGNVVNDISYAIQEHCESFGFGVVRVLVGHGIGKNLHEEPSVPNFYSRGNNFKLRKNMTIAIEHMINYGTYDVETLDDGWTVVTADGLPSAHFEHTVLITDGEPEILT